MSNPYDPSQQNQQQWGQSPYPDQPGQGYDAGAPQGAPPQGQGQWGQPQQWGPPAPQGGQWGGDQAAQQWQQPAQPAQIDWNTAPPQPGQGAWQGPDPYAAPAPPQQPAPSPEQPAQAPSQGEPWVASGTAQTAQEVADQWQSSQPAAPAADYQQQPAADPYQPPAPEPQQYQPPAQQPEPEPEQYEPPAGQPYQPATPEPQYQPPTPEPQPQQYQQPEAPQQQWPSYDAPAQSPSINEAATVTTPAVADPAAQQEEEPEALTIGRGRDNSIVLDDMLVSRQHVRITADAGGLVLEDLGSRNGTYVNGRRVERTHLSEGDRIGIGAATFEVRDGWLLNV